jgi:hypothetical protein
MTEQAEPYRMSDRQLAAVLVELCRYQVEYHQARRLKDAVEMRKHARNLGREIHRRIELGVWCYDTKQTD